MLNNGSSESDDSEAICRRTRGHDKVLAVELEKKNTNEKNTSDSRETAAAEKPSSEDENENEMVLVPTGDDFEFYGRENREFFSFLFQFGFMKSCICFFRSIWMDSDKHSIVAYVDHEKIQYRTSTYDCPISTHGRRTGENVACWILCMRRIERRWQYIG